MELRGDLPVAPFASADTWERWLQEHHQTARGIWLKLAKQGSGLASVSYEEAVEVALCFGWIDGQKGACDERHWLQRCTPRGPRSRWSQINRERAVALERAGRMQPAGLLQVERAKADGRWEEAYEGQARAQAPEDLQRELDRDPAARAFFMELESHNRYAILYRIQEARRPQTRARRIERYMEMLRAKERLHP